MPAPKHLQFKEGVTYQVEKFFRPELGFLCIYTPVDNGFGLDRVYTLPVVYRLSFMLDNGAMMEAFCGKETDDPSYTHWSEYRSKIFASWPEICKQLVANVNEEISKELLSSAQPSGEVN